MPSSASCLSVGRMFYEPIWVYSRGDLPVASLRDLKGMKILTGTKESGARRIVNQLLKANGIDKTNATLIDQDLPADAAPLFDGRADVAITIAPPDSDKMQELLRVQQHPPDGLLGRGGSLRQPLPGADQGRAAQGIRRVQSVIPSDDITLLATTAALVVRSDMHPALVSLLTHAVVSNPKSGFDKQGDPVLFYRAGDFPSASDPEFTVPADARAIYKSGELPFLLRFLAPLNARMGVPFSYTAFINSYAAQVLLILIPLLAVIVPLSKAIPAIYIWNVRRKLIYWYRQLKKLERNLDSRGAKYDLAAHQTELERIDGAVRRIRVPNFFSNELYDLRMHIDLVRQRLSARPSHANGGGVERLRYAATRTALANRLGHGRPFRHAFFENGQSDMVRCRLARLRVTSGDGNGDEQEETADYGIHGVRRAGLCSTSAAMSRP